MKYFHKKQDLLNEIETLETKPDVLIDFLDKKGVHKYTYCDTHKELFENISKFEYDNNYYVFEIIQNDTKRKPSL